MLPQIVFQLDDDVLTYQRFEERVEQLKNAGIHKS